MLLSSILPPTYTPKKIISLVPSITELLHYLALEDETIAITKFCVHPQAWHKNKMRIGGTKNIDIEKIIAFKPDLILCNKEENVREQIETLATSLPVYMCDVKNYNDALQMIIDIGMLTGKEIAAKALIAHINASFKKNNLLYSNKIATAYLIWKAPYMTIGGDTFISDMMSSAGFDNIYKNETRYPTKTIEQLQADKPALILLSSEPYPFKEKNISELKAYFPHTKILIADGEMFSWYGSRMLFAAEYFKNLLSQFHSA
jgi:ABC-type Fe3+-hydroxamate transport system substrate-binding protein